MKNFQTGIASIMMAALSAAVNQRTLGKPHSTIAVSTAIYKPITVVKKTIVHSSSFRAQAQTRSLLTRFMEAIFWVENQCPDSDIGGIYLCMSQRKGIINGK